MMTMTTCPRCSSHLIEIEDDGDMTCLICSFSTPRQPERTMAERIAANKADGIYGLDPERRGRGRPRNGVRV